MSDQYKIRKEIFIFLVLLVICGAIFAGITNAQTRENCPKTGDVITFTGNFNIRSNPGFSTDAVSRSVVGETLAGHSYTVAEVDPGRVCQIRVSQGWVSALSSAWSYSVRLEGDTTTPLSIDDACYLSNVAYVTGKMNIREEATTKSKVINQTETRTAYHVRGSHQGDTWCWLKLDRGWMADTDYVSKDISSVLPPIEIEGHTWLTSKILKAFEFLSNKSPRWFNYTVPKIHTIVEYDSGLEAIAQVNPRRRTITMGNYMRDMRDTQDHIANLAATFIHEACHVYQWDSGDKVSVFDFSGISRLERECYGVEAGALSNIAPGHRQIQGLRCFARRYDALLGSHKWECD